MKTGEPGLRARAVFPSEAVIRALQQPHRGRRALAVPSAHGLSWLTPFVVSLLLCAGLALTPAQTEAAYAATELASLAEGLSRVVRAANDAKVWASGSEASFSRGVMTSRWGVAFLYLVTLPVASMVSSANGGPCIL